MPDIDELQDRLGFRFNNTTLLIQALTHRSYLNENPDATHSDNERLEFLGDALLDFITAEYLYDRFPSMREGDLTNLRAALVKSSTLANFARQIDLGEYLLLGRGEAAGGGRNRRTLLCAAFEALSGAILLDQGLTVAQDFLLRFIEPALENITANQLDKDAKSELQELSQGKWQLTPSYRTVSEEGPDHAKEFTVEVLIGGEVFGRGIGRNKQTAAQRAARQALEKINMMRGT
ncbi:MAG: ribonuclease III [Chloroflexi bacterium]|nr:MAG: ribonuclease III [Chloroflexota bacterium]